MWYEYLYRVLSIVNYVVLIMIAIPLLVQVLYVCFCWVKKRHYPESDVKAKIAYLIPAHNEDSVIFDTVKLIFEKQDYPKDKIEVYVVADNCTDKTKELAEKAGAIVLVHNDPDPAHHMALYPLKYGVDYLINKEDAPELIIHLDADNHLSDNFSRLMHDAYQSGVDFARPYEGGTNATQNFYTKACTIFYSFDSRYGSRVRERLNLAAHVNGAGAVMSTRMLRKCGGYDATTISDDAEFNFNRMLEGVNGHYVEDAVVYQDMPSSFSDTINRTKRIGSGSMKLLKTKLKEMMKRFFKEWNWSYLEMFLTYIFNFLAIVLCVWIPLFYIYNFVFLANVDVGNIAVTWKDVSYYHNVMWTTIWCAVGIIGGLFLFFCYIQGFFLVMTDYKRIGAKRRRDMISAVFCFPIFFLLYAGALAIGGMSKPKWKAIKRNPNAGK